MSRLLPVSLSLAGLALCLGCPAKVPTPEQQATPTPATPEVTATEDPRVVRDGDDLYAAESAPRPLPGQPALGSGKPDTSNGVCKLFAPKLEEPHCCPFETGFDAERVQQLCGHALYMGESLHQSCGYFFLPDMNGSAPVSMRGSKINREDVSEAAADHDLRLGRLTNNDAFESTPIPGVEGAVWSQADGLNWAFLPGWSSVRLISWADDACPRDAMPEVLKLIAEAKQPPENAPRPDLLPKARQ
ncbi:hypothetical protein [Enhygromyxa salina]|uniref:Lipoprotein n=1 Tax=Enhygromyxa salina TaxID=215803 RepID=A0A2S9YLL1_9BACT|nr:hypothetical protein [Enhygromyxa salina]PRQ05995.1 hypothetical protein ENSA7_42570 [Enhygromyxa salina]